MLTDARAGDWQTPPSQASLNLSARGSGSDDVKARVKLVSN